MNPVRGTRATLTIAIAALLSVVTGSTVAAQTTPVGRWRTFNDKTGKAESIVVISEVDGEMQGRVERVFAPPAPSENPLCEKCSGDRKNKPVVGMLIMWGMKKNGDKYNGGRLFDPAVGNTYRGSIRLTDGGRRLEVHGFLGFSMFGRTQTWARESGHAQDQLSPRDRRAA